MGLLPLTIPIYACEQYGILQNMYLSHRYTLTIPIYACEQYGILQNMYLSHRYGFGMGLI